MLTKVNTYPNLLKFTQVTKARIKASGHEPKVPLPQNPYSRAKETIITLFESIY